MAAAWILSGGGTYGSAREERGQRDRVANPKGFGSGEGDPRPTLFLLGSGSFPFKSSFPIFQK